MAAPRVKDALLNQRGRLADKLDARLPGRASPGRGCAAGRGNCHLGVCCIAFLHTSQHPISVDRRADIELLIGKHFLAVDEHPIFLAQVLLERGDSLVEALVHFFGWIEHGGVREFESHTSSS